MDRVLDFAERFSKPLSILSGIWFALTCASYAGFISLPKFALLSGWSAIAASGVWNAIWWGYFYPQAEERRLSRAAKEHVDG
jgi:hypothetical protein